ncbi:hypothetical protein ABH931_006113 [Streptacidiphilus sp. MAP12-33]|uniref:hypothetical protein n=1 Tax=Streptacidiphilus sp. MAP12-33 TaxID=3156266 RepID=UPI00351827F1
MTGPFSVEERLEILRAEVETSGPWHFHRQDVAALIAEVDRLRSAAGTSHPRVVALAELQSAVQEGVAQILAMHLERIETRALALREGAAALDAIADHVESRVLDHFNGACGKGSCDMVRECARTLREMAAGQPAPVRTEGEQR